MVACAPASTRSRSRHPTLSPLVPGPKLGAAGCVDHRSGMPDCTHCSTNSVVTWSSCCRCACASEGDTPCSADESACCVEHAPEALRSMSSCDSSSFFLTRSIILRFFFASAVSALLWRSSCFNSSSISLRTQLCTTCPMVDKPSLHTVVDLPVLTP